MILYLLISLVLLYIFIKIWAKFYFIKVDNTLMFTGAPGTGKTNEMVNWALRLYKKNLKKVKRHNRWKKDKSKYNKIC